MGNLLVLVACPPTDDASYGRPLLDLGQRISAAVEKRKIALSQTVFFRPNSSAGRATLGTLMAGVSSTASFTAAQLRRSGMLDAPSPDNFREMLKTASLCSPISVFVATPGYIAALVHYAAAESGQELSAEQWLFLNDPAPAVFACWRDGKLALFAPD